MTTARTPEARLSRYWYFTQDFVDDPRPYLDRVRAETPVYEIPSPDGGRAWLVTRYAEAREALADQRLSRDLNRLYRKSSEDAGREITAAEEMTNHLANNDPPRHTKLRRALAFAFTPRRVDALRPRFAEATEALLDAMAAKPEPDLVVDFAQPLPVITVAQLMGVPAADTPSFERWSHSLRHVDPFNDPDGVLDRDVRDLSAYLKGLIARKSREPGDDLISALVHGSGDKRLTDLEVLSTSFGLMTGGNDSSTALIAGGVLDLLTHPEQKAKMIADDFALLPQAVDELLRHVSPITSALSRITLEPVEIGGVTIPEGEVVIIMLGSANFDDELLGGGCPHLDVTRPKTQHLSFGHGIHFCVGSHMAKAVTEIALRRLFERFPDIRLASDRAGLNYQHNPGLRSLLNLPVHLS